MSKRVAGLVELLGILVVLAGGCGLVAAASVVSVALAVLVASMLLVGLGVVMIYLAATLEKKPAVEARRTPGEDR